ncbi:MAG TPA: hypothetical protein DEQ28_04460 [Clostridiales bacterium]|nr:hypothetical protein [Clostridiales bacterium]
MKPSAGVWLCYGVYLLLLVLLTWGSGSDFRGLGLDWDFAIRLALSMGLRTRHTGIITPGMEIWYVYRPAGGVFLAYAVVGAIVAGCLDRWMRRREQRARPAGNPPPR